MKYQIAWRIKNTTLLHFSPKFFEDRKEADELIEGLSLEHPKYDHGVQECDDAGHHLGIVVFPGESPKPTLPETRLLGEVKVGEVESPEAILDPQEILREQVRVPQEQSDTCPGQIDIELSSPSCDL